MKYLLPKILLLLSGFMLAHTSVAHEAGITDTGVQISRDSVKLTYTVPQKLVDTLDIDVLHNGTAAQGLAIVDGISIQNAGIDCPGRVTGEKLLDTIESSQFSIKYECEQPITRLFLDYKLFFDQDTEHSNIVRFSLLGTHQDNTLTSEHRQLSVDVESMVRHFAKIRQSVNSDNANNTNTNTLSGFKKTFGTQYFPVGFWHILLGYDHVLFLICLVLLPMSRMVIFSLITSFTVAHSITLSLSVLDIVTLQPKFIEALIALSIVYVSTRTIVILRRSKALPISKSHIKERVLSSFLFGLIHGFGFSYLLKEIGFGDQLLASLFFFNLGVEAGQLAILVFLLPLVWWLGKRYPDWHWASAASVVTGLFGLLWFVERTLLS